MGSSLALVALGAAGAMVATGARPVATAAPAPTFKELAVAADLAEASHGSAEPVASASQPSQGTPICRVRSGPRLAWVEETSPDARRVYRSMGKGRAPVPDIYKAMSLRPDLMQRVADLTDRAHFRDGFLDRRTKELIATYVSSLNGCGYCLGSHLQNLRALGAGGGGLSAARQARAVARQELDQASLSGKERRLLDFIKTLTLSPAKVGDDEIRALRRAGWRDEQIFEAAFEASLFAFFNRMAETYGLDAPVEELAFAHAGRRQP
jgi:uncharacterized peroxidase-related enzyme